jgi:malate permease and related proteins
VKLISDRYGVGLACAIILYFVMYLEPMFRDTVPMRMVLPISMTVITYSVQLGYDYKFVGTVTNFTIILSFILVWIIGIAVN